MNIERETKLRLLTTMLRIRLCEEKVHELFLNNKIPGFSHVSIGQEAVAAGVCAALHPDDYITSTGGPKQAYSIHTVSGLPS